MVDSGVWFVFFLLISCHARFRCVVCDYTLLWDFFQGGFLCVAGDCIMFLGLLPRSMLVEMWMFEVHIQMCPCMYILVSVSLHAFPWRESSKRPVRCLRKKQCFVFVRSHGRTNNSQVDLGVAPLHPQLNVAFSLFWERFRAAKKTEFSAWRRCCEVHQHWKGGWRGQTINHDTQCVCKVEDPGGKYKTPFFFADTGHKSSKGHKCHHFHVTTVAISRVHYSPRHAWSEHLRAKVGCTQFGPSEGFLEWYFIFVHTLIQLVLCSHASEALLDSRFDFRVAKLDTRSLDTHLLDSCLSDSHLSDSRLSDSHLSDSCLLRVAGLWVVGAPVAGLRAVGVPVAVFGSWVFGPCISSIWWYFVDWSICEFGEILYIDKFES